VLLADAARGREAAFRELVGRHLRPVLAVARRMLGDDAEAEDVAQETMLRLWRNADGIEVGEGGVRPWLYRVASNLCLDRIRSRRTAPETGRELPEQGVPADQLKRLEQEEMSARVDRALQALPERQRMALVLFHYQGLSQSEASAMLEVSEDALESLLARGRRALKTALAGEWRSLLPDAGETDGGWKRRDDEEA
jgi:RNA polymerase sigma-70 factor (ECF subfamily)